MKMQNITKEDLIIQMLQNQMEMLKQIQHQVEQHDRRFEALDKRFETIDKRFERIDRRFDKIDERFEKIDEHFTEIRQMLEKIQSRNVVWSSWLVSGIIAISTIINFIITRIMISGVKIADLFRLDFWI